MTIKKQTDQNEKKTEPAETTPCPKCKGAGVIFTTDLYRTGTICCDRCSSGDRIWSWLLELLADVEMPSAVSARPETTDNVGGTHENDIQRSQ
jgi:acetyl-CoA carboxylase beta subunit